MQRTSAPSAQPRLQSKSLLLHPIFQPDIQPAIRTDRHIPSPKNESTPSAIIKQNSSQTSPKPQSKSSSEEQAKDNSDDSDNSDAKSRLRARNRKAAAKFRVRKKHSVERLQDHEASMREINRTLADEASQLREETLQLKSMVLEHAGCGCSRIDDYIQHAATTLTREAPACFGSPWEARSLSLGGESTGMGSMEEDALLE
ncbi:transcription factor [Amphichorda felina]